MPSDDRDRKFERALAQHLRGGSAQANCPDAETLAAYHERNLSLEEMARWKQHISACEACQEALALAEATENQLAEDWEERGIPVHEAASVPGAQAGSVPKRTAKADAASAPHAAATPVAINRRRPVLLRWAIPLGALAAGVLVFIGIYEQRAPKVARYSDTVIARHQQPAPPGQVLDQQAAKAQPRPESKDLPLSSAEISRQKSELELPAAPTAKPGERTKDTGDAAWESRDQLGSGRLEKKRLPPSPSPSPKIPSGAAADITVSENAPVVAAAPSPPPPPAPSALRGGVGGATPRRSAPAPSDAKSAPPAITQTVTVETEAAAPDTSTSVMMMKQGVANELAQVARSDAGLILTPDNKVFWKLRPAGTLQLTTDGGKKWKSLDSGANADLTAGVAPSSRVCWLAGKAGTLLLTTDRGRHWTRISTPITGDLGGVRASDAKHATIWDATKQIGYETSDGGATWKQTSSK
jgi:Photosynthesis system II assembly factor YCF48